MEGRKGQVIPTLSLLATTRVMYEKWTPNDQATSYCELKELLVMEQFVNMTKKKVVLLLQEEI